MTTQPSPSAPPTFAVIGGTGQTGRRVAARLGARGYGVRVGSRRASPPFVWERPETWEPVLRGCVGAYIAYASDFNRPGAMDTLRAFAEQAARCGVERLVFLSGRGEADAQRAEEQVRAAGVPVAVLRASLFAQNFSEHFLHPAVLDGVLALPAGGVAEPLLDVEDLADIAFLLLTAPEASTETFELTGPRLLTFTEVAAELSAALDRPVVYLPLTTEKFVEGAVDAGVDREVAEALGAVFEEIFDGRNTYTTDTVERLLGRPAGDFAAYARRTQASGAWRRSERAEVPA